MSNSTVWGNVTPGNENTKAGTQPSNSIRSEALFSIYDAGKPVHVQDLCKRFGMQFNPFCNWLGSLTRQSAIPSNIGHTIVNGTYTPDAAHWTAWEENRYYDTCTVTASQSISDGASAAATDVKFDSSTAGVYYGKQWDILMTPDGKTFQITVVAYTPGNAYVTFTLKPHNATGNVKTTFDLLKGDEVIVLTNAQAGGMAGTTGYSQGWTPRQFFLQILKGATAWEGHQLTSQLWFEPAFNMDGSVKGLVSYDQAITQSRLERDLSGAYLFGNLNQSAITQTSARTSKTNYVYTMKGLIPTIQDLGNTYEIAANAFDLDDLYNIKDYMIREGITSNTALLAVGSKLSKNIDDAIKTYLQGNGTDFTKEVMDFFDLNGNGNDTSRKDMAIAMGFRNIYMYGFNWVKNEINEFSDPTSFGAPGYNYPTAGLVIPMGYVKQPNGANSEMNIAEKYVEANGYSRKVEIIPIAGAGNWNPKVIADDLAEIQTRMHRGLQIMSANNCTYIPPASSAS